MDQYSWWQVFIFGIGVIAIISVIGALFFATGTSPKKFFTNIPMPAVDTPEFALALSHSLNVPLEKGGTIEILNNGDEFYPSLVDAFEHAKKTINFSVYIWEDGEASNKVLPVLIKKQKEGVQVRVLLDALGSKSSPDDLFDELKKVGGKVEVYRPVRYGKISRYHRRNHRRSIVTDGQVGFIGGMAVSDSWLGHAQDTHHWRDMMFKVTGSMARSVQDAFVDHWAGSSGEILIGPDIYANSFPADQNTPIQYIHMASSPADDSLPIPKFLLIPMMAATKTLHIATPYFVGDENTMRVLTEKAQSGVDVRLMVPGKNIDNKTSRWVAQNYYHELLEAGVKVYEYEPTFFHSKFFVVDDTVSIIGSANLNSRSRRLDEENVMAVFDPTLAQKLSAIFSEDLQQSTEMNLQEWRKRSQFSRILQALSQLITQQS